MQCNGTHFQTRRQAFATYCELGLSVLYRKFSIVMSIYVRVGISYIAVFIALVSGGHENHSNISADSMGKL